MKVLLPFLFVFILPLIPAKAQNSTDSVLQNISLEKAVEIALKNNPDVQKSAIRAETEKIYWRQAKENLLPDLNANYSQGISAGQSFDPSTSSYVNQRINYASPAIGSNLTLFNGFARFNTIRRNALTFQASKLEEQQAKDDLTLHVILAYLQVLSNNEFLEQAKKQRETSLKQVERLEILNRNGDVAPGQYYDLKGQYANDQMSVVNGENNLENSKVALVQYLNIPYDKNLKVEKLTAEQFSLAYDASANQVYTAALQNLALVKAADLRKQSAEADIKVNRSGYYPSVILNGNLSSNYSSASSEESYSRQLKNNLSRNFSVGIAIPLFNSFRTRNAVALAKLNQKDADITAQTTRVQLQQLTAQAYFNMTSSKESYTTVMEQVNAFAESFRTAEIRFNAGAINSVDYLIAKNNLDRARLNLISARYDFILRKKILDYYQGKALW